MKILFIQTGGTIDKDYPKGAGAYSFEIADPAVMRVLGRSTPSFKYHVLPLLRKDSTDITDEDRAAIVAACQEAGEDKIVITHGTDTMNITADALSGITDKVIIITGSLRPERFAESDAAFNVGTAVGAVQTLQPGVYIAMSGVVLPWGQIRKDPATGNFLPVGD